EVAFSSVSTSSGFFKVRNSFLFCPFQADQPIVSIMVESNTQVLATRSLAPTNGALGNSSVSSLVWAIQRKVKAGAFCVAAGAAILSASSEYFTTTAVW